MNIHNLQQTLLKKGLRPNAVSFIPGKLTAAEQYCIEPATNKGWEVYYFERGNKNDLHHFDDEDSACAYLLDILMKDHTVWIHRPSLPV